MPVPANPYPFYSNLNCKLCVNANVATCFAQSINNGAGDRPICDGRGRAHTFGDTAAEASIDYDMMAMTQGCTGINAYSAALARTDWPPLVGC